MPDQIAQSTIDTYRLRIADAKTEAEVDALEHELFGRKQGVLTLAMQGMEKLSMEEKREHGSLVNRWKLELTEALANRRTELQSSAFSSLKQTDPLDVALELPERERGHLHLIPEFIEEVKELFGRMGFDHADGPEIESEEYNFNLLNIPADHPARDNQDTFWIERADKDPNKRFVLRTHTSPVQIRYMQTHKPPFRMICTGKVYRKDADATHSPMFHQIEGLMIGEDVNLANMKAVMITAIRELVNEKAEFRFRSGFFPFVEPGLEVDMRWQGDEDESREGRWLEVVGCGMVHPNVLKNCGVDPSKYQGFAFGFGIERLLMIRHQIPDLRSFYEGDLRFLKQF